MSAARGTGSADQNQGGKTLVCFAVREEAKYFRPANANCRVVVSGIGKANAERALLKSIEDEPPRLVLTCGYAGGLNPRFKHGDVLFDADAGSTFAHAFANIGAMPAKFHCADRIIATTAEKRTLFQTTNADAVEMESGVIRELCRQRGIPSATIRVISDDAGENLPMDFNKIAGADGNMNYLKLAGALLKSPGLVPKLMRFQRELDGCSRKLADALGRLLATLPD
jgi:adenosylhomocysteine nucleosidase